MKKVKIQTVVGYPEEIISTMTDLIIKGEVNVVLFNQYDKFFSPEKLEDELSKSININNGFDSEYIYIDDKRSGLKFRRQGEDRIDDVDVVEFLDKGGCEDLIFPDGMVDQIDVVIKNYVKGILPGLIKEGLNLNEILDSQDILWDYVVELIGDLEEDVKKLIWSYDEKKDFTLWGFIYDELKTRIVMEMSSKVVC